jgi:hypothetical protein
MDTSVTDFTSIDLEFHELAAAIDEECVRQPVRSVGEFGGHRAQAASPAALRDPVATSASAAGTATTMSPSTLI